MSRKIYSHMCDAVLLKVIKKANTANQERFTDVDDLLYALYSEFEQIVLSNPELQKDLIKMFFENYFTNAMKEFSSAMKENEEVGQ